MPVYTGGDYWMQNSHWKARGQWAVGDGTRSKIENQVNTQEMAPSGGRKGRQKLKSWQIPGLNVLCSMEASKMFSQAEQELMKEQKFLFVWIKILNYVTLKKLKIKNKKLCQIEIEIETFEMLNNLSI